MASPTSGDRLPWFDASLRVAGDHVRTARYRLLQSWYRETILDADYGTYTSRGEVRPCGSLLAPGQPTGLNFLSPTAAAYAEARAKEVVPLGGSIEVGRLQYNMLSSMPLCFSIFGEVRAQAERGLEFVRALFDPSATAIVAMECEWKPSTNLLGDRTAFDAMVITERSDGRRHLIGIETKYTEPFSQKAYDTEPYEGVHTASEWFRSPARALGASSTNQLWRNMLLAAACEKASEQGVSSAEVCVLALADDRGAAKAIAGVSEHLVEPDVRCRSVSFESMVAAAASIPTLSAWSADFRKRYLDTSLVERY